MICGLLSRLENSSAAEDAGINVIYQNWNCLSPLGGALAKLLLPAKMGAGGPVGGKTNAILDFTRR